MSLCVWFVVGLNYLWHIYICIIKEVLVVEVLLDSRFALYCSVHLWADIEHCFGTRDNSRIIIHIHIYIYIYIYIYLHMQHHRYIYYRSSYRYCNIYTVSYTYWRSTHRHYNVNRSYINIRRNTRLEFNYLFPALSFDSRGWLWLQQSCLSHQS